VLIFLLGYLLFLNKGIFAQLTQVKSLEIEIKAGTSTPDFNIRPLQNGEFLFEERNEEDYGRKNTIWAIKKYSNNMEMVWTKDIPIDYDLNPGILTITKEAYYQSFTSTNDIKIKILKIDLEKGDSEWIEGELIGIQDITQMKVIGNTAFFSGKFQGRAVVLGLSFFDKKVKVINGLYSNYMEVVEIEVDESETQLQVFSRNRYKKLCQLQMSIFNEDGQQILTTKTESDIKKTPFNGRINKINNTESLLIGNYSRACDNFSQGIYVKKLLENQEVKSKFIDFSDFNNFFNYLNPKRQKKVKAKLTKRKLEGKDIRFNYSMLLHKIYDHQNQIIIVAEIYYIEPRNSNSMPFYINGKDYSPYNYRFTHTIICGFDYEGNKLWDNCLPMKNLRSYYLNEQVQLSFDGNKMVLAYPENGTIKTQLIEEGKTIREKETFEVLSKKVNFWDEKDLGGLSAWNNQNFLYWGFKTNPDATYIEGRKVFFINKLSYELKNEK
jgi:hypothetical protein